MAYAHAINMDVGGLNSSVYTSMWSPVDALPLVEI